MYSSNIKILNILEKLSECNEINLKNNWIIFKDDKDLNRLNMNLKSN